MSKYSVTIDGQTFEVELEPTRLGVSSDLAVRVDGQTLTVHIPEGADEIEWLVIDGRPYELCADRELKRLRAFNGLHQVEIHDKQAAVARPSSGDGRIKAPIPGLIRRLLVEPGQMVEAGQPVVVLEAMKMENELRAPRSGKVGAMHVTVGQTVARGQVLGEIE